MSGWRKHAGSAVALDLESIDTDQLIPARFMSTPRSEGYGQFLLHDLSKGPDGAASPGFPLNAHPDASVIVTRRNFGSGSSREAAVYALVDFGIRAVIAPSFGDIFASNAVNNGLLPARVASEVAGQMIARLSGRAAPVSIDLDTGSLTLAGQTAAFELDPVWREKLVNGWDDIDLTLARRPEIAAFRDELSRRRSWAFPAAGTAD